MESKNYFILGNFLIWCIENELWKENVKIEDWLLSITSGNFLMVNFCKPIYLLFYVPRMPKRHVYIFWGFWEPCQIYLTKKDKFKHCDVFTVNYFEFVSIFGAKTFSGRLECMSEKFNRDPQKFNEGITI